MNDRVLACLLLSMIGFAGHVSAVTVAIVDSRDGRPVAGAIGHASGANRTANAQGVFSLDVAAGGTRLSLRAPGYARAEVLLAPAELERTVSMTAVRPKAVYLSAFGVANSTLRDSALSLQGKTVINALVIDVKGDSGATPYSSPARESAGAAAHAPVSVLNAAELRALLQKFHARGLYLIARIVVFKDDPLAGAHPEWAVRDEQGRIWRDRQQQRWIDPGIRAAWQHNYEVAEEAARLGFDEIQFDYLRFPDANGLSFKEPNTEANRVAAIVAFLIGARERLQPYNLYMSADIFGYVCWNTDDTAIGQRLEALAEVVDYVSPMLYPSGFTWGLPGCRKPTERPGEIVSRSLAEAVRRTGLSPIRFRPWLQAFRDYAFDRRPFDADEIHAQVDASDAAGTDGWMLWNPRNQYDPATLPH